ncbi:MAG: methylmalonyl Co-A mutase-associated GTPase MeaB, partial [Actinomycetota bacterium]
MATRSDDPAQLFAAASKGDRGSLARLLSFVERGGGEAREVARLASPHVGRAYVVGITGAPGAGKSTLTSAIIGALRARGARVGVLAID